MRSLSTPDSRSSLPIWTRNIIAALGILSANPACGNDTANTHGFNSASATQGNITAVVPSTTSGDPTTGYTNTAEDNPTGAMGSTEGMVGTTDTSGTTGNDTMPGASTGDSTETTGGGCSVTCWDMTKKSTYFNLNDYVKGSDPCTSKYGFKALNWSEALDAALKFPLAGTQPGGVLCMGFNPEYDENILDPLAYDLLSPDEQFDARCAKFIGAIDDIPGNYSEPICPGDAEALVNTVERQYQSRQGRQQLIPVNSEGNSTVTFLEVGAALLGGPYAVELRVSMGQYLGDLPENCWIKTENYLGYLTSTFVDPNVKPVKQSDITFYPLVLEKGYNRVSLQCSTTGKQDGNYFCIQGWLYDNENNFFPPNIEHSMVTTPQCFTIKAQ